MGGKVQKGIEFWEDVAKREAPAVNPSLTGENSAAQASMASAPAPEEANPLASMLEAHLADTGRVNPLSEESFAKREAHSKVVLEDMESSTVARQKAENTARAPDEQRPLTHAVSGHGKGTDQMGRLLHGRRADEMTEDVESGATPSSDVALTGNTHGLSDRSTPEYTTVGSDPNNISGAFNSHSGMLHAVESGFAQATMLEGHQRAERAKQKKAGDAPTAAHDQERFATQVSGDGSDLGYNLSLSGDKQKTGEAVSASDMQSRFEDVEREDGLKNATVVLDPAFIDGKRAGWQVQTAFANNDAPTSDMANPEAVGAELQRKEDLAAASQNTVAKRSDLKNAEKARDAAIKQSASLRKKAAGMQKGIDAGGPKANGMKIGQGKMIEKADAIDAGMAALHQAVTDAQDALTKAEAVEASLS